MPLACALSRRRDGRATGDDWPERAVGSSGRERAQRVENYMDLAGRDLGRGRSGREHHGGLDDAVAALVEVDHPLDRPPLGRDLLEVLEQARVDLGERAVAQLEAARVAGDADELEERGVRGAHAA